MTYLSIVESAAEKFAALFFFELNKKNQPIIWRYQIEWIEPV